MTGYQLTVGVPRALLYYYYYPMWAAFFEDLGARVITSGETNKRVLDAGIKLTVDEVCMPVKIFFGHVSSLEGRCDYVFVPRLVSVERRAFICPKFMGLPDMVKAAKPGAGDIISPCINLSKNDREFRKQIFETGSLFTRNKRRILRAYSKAKEVLGRFRTLVYKGYMPEEAMQASLTVDRHDEEIAASMLETRPASGRSPITVGVLGHPYLLYDSHANMDLMARLKSQGCRVVTCDMLPPEIIEAEARTLPRWLFWTLGRRILGAGFHFAHSKGVHGILHITAFGCGLDSVVGELIEREVKRSGDIPLMGITLDEHTGEAGIITRIEAFVDMIRRRISV